MKGLARTSSRSPVTWRVPVYGAVPFAAAIATSAPWSPIPREWERAIVAVRLPRQKVPSLTPTHPKIPAFEYGIEIEADSAAIEAAVRRVLSSGHVILGPEVEAFETEFAEYVGASHAVGVGTGTDAITIALAALGIGGGDEVITVANAGVPPVNGVRAAGATPRFVDIDPDTLLLDPRRLEAALSSHTRAILLVHLYGQPAALDPILEFAQSHQLRVIEDCAQAHGARYRERHVGSIGDVGCFSFYPTKNLGAYGDAGMCVTNDLEIAKQIRMQRMYGYGDQRQSLFEGRNSRLDELQAAILRVKLANLGAAVSTRRILAERYRKGLEGLPFRHPSPTEHGDHAYHLFVVEAPNRGLLSRALDDAQVGHGIHYEFPVHQMDAYRELAHSELLITERACERVLSLPLYPSLPETAVDRVIDVLREAASRQPTG
jgi:dTDP-4-amino-4,6-dideoxygalactose transaminase